jgi:hypothetical protein
LGDKTSPRGLAERHIPTRIWISASTISERSFFGGLLRDLARKLDDRHLPGLVTDFGEW